MPRRIAVIVELLEKGGVVPRGRGRAYLGRGLAISNCASFTRVSRPLLERSRHP